MIQSKFAKKNILHMTLIFFLMGMLCIFSTNSYAKKTTKKPTVLKTAVGYDQVGTASWYGAELHGRPTVTGKRFNMNALTAASRVLPLGSYVQVTNLSNNKSVVVQINDRGPFHSNRIIDLSHAAAKQLAFLGKGVTRVHIVGIEDKDAPMRLAEK